MKKYLIGAAALLAANTVFAAGADYCYNINNNDQKNY